MVFGFHGNKVNLQFIYFTPQNIEHHILCAKAPGIPHFQVCLHIRGTGTKQHISHTNVYYIIFSRVLRYCFPLTLYLFCLIDNITFHKCPKILFNRFYIDFLPSEVIGNLLVERDFQCYRKQILQCFQASWYLKIYASQKYPWLRLYYKYHQGNLWVLSAVLIAPMHMERNCFQYKRYIFVQVTVIFHTATYSSKW